MSYCHFIFDTGVPQVCSGFNSLTCKYVYIFIASERCLSFDYYNSAARHGTIKIYYESNDFEGRREAFETLQNDTWQKANVHFPEFNGLKVRMTLYLASFKCMLLCSFFKASLHCMSRHMSLGMCDC